MMLEMFQIRFRTQFRSQIFIPMISQQVSGSYFTGFAIRSLNPYIVTWEIFINRREYLVTYGSTGPMATWKTCVWIFDWPPNSILANLVIYGVFIKKSTFRHINGHPKQHILVDTIFNTGFISDFRENAFF